MILLRRRGGVGSCRSVVDLRLTFIFFLFSVDDGAFVVVDSMSLLVPRVFVVVVDVC
jgi:hypothetical protein